MAAPAHRLRFRTTYTNCIRSVLLERGWQPTAHNSDWDLIWADTGWMREVFDTFAFQEGQRANHFRNHTELTRKDKMVKNLKRTQKRLEKEGHSAIAAEFSFFPPTFILPLEYPLFKERFRDEGPSPWIMKPVGKAQGRGIFIFYQLSKISQWRRAAQHDQEARGPDAGAYVCQRYINNPYLIGGKKFDMRIYVLVTSYNPLVVWVCRHGFSRFTFNRYSADLHEMSDASIHLTNVAIQKKTDGYAESEDGCKWDLARVRQFFESKHGRPAVDEAFWLIDRLIVRSLQAVAPVVSQTHVRRHAVCFELYGYDVMFDDTLFPWLIEVNAFPSLTADTPHDRALKHSMLHDMITILDIEGRGLSRITWRPEEAPKQPPRKAPRTRALIPKGPASPAATSLPPPPPTEGRGRTQVGCWDMVFHGFSLRSLQKGVSRRALRARPGLLASSDPDAGWVAPGASRLGCIADRFEDLRQVAHDLERARARRRTK